MQAADERKSKETLALLHDMKDDDDDNNEKIVSHQVFSRTKTPTDGPVSIKKTSVPSHLTDGNDG